MYAAIAFALIASVAAVDPAFTSYSSLAQQYPVQSVGYNGALVQRHAYPVVHQKVVSPVVQRYGAHVVDQRVVSPVVHSYGVAQKVVSPYGGYVGQDAAVQREFHIENFGERHAIQSGPRQFQYSFVRGVDAPHAVVAEKIVAPAVYGGYGVPQYAQVAAGIPAVYGSQHVYGSALRTGPIVKKVEAFGVKNLIK